MRSNWGRGRPNMGSWLPYDLHNIPVVRGCLIAIVTLFLIHFLVFPLRGPLEEWLSFQAAPESLRWLRPWTWVTYAFLVLSPISLLFNGLWLYSVGGTLERSWGSLNFAAIFAGLTAVAALGMVPAAYLFHTSMGLQGLWIPLVSLFVAWAALDPEQELSIFFIRLRLKVWAALAVLLLYFGYGYGSGPRDP